MIEDGGTFPDERVTSPWLTVLVPTYNRAGFVRLFLERLALLAQGRDWDFQIVVSDNLAIDATADVLAELQLRYPAISVVRPPKHLPSAEANMAFALKFCQGERVWIVGDDDYIIDEAFARIEQTCNRFDFDFFLFNNPIFYAPDETGLPMIPMIGSYYMCSISEIISRVGFTTLAASITCVVCRTQKLSETLQRMIEVSPYYAHVAAYLDAFKGSQCGFGGEQIAFVREAASAPVTFDEVIKLANVRSAGPWGFGLAALIERLIEIEAVDPDFLPSVIELGHERRYFLREYILIHCLKQLRAWVKLRGSPAEAVTDADLRAVRTVCRTSGPSTREIVSRISEIVLVIRAAFDFDPGGPSANSSLGPQFYVILEYISSSAVFAVEAITDWVNRETGRLEESLQRSLTVGKEGTEGERYRNYQIFRRGIDLVAIQDNVVPSVECYVDLSLVNPVASPPQVLICRTRPLLKTAIDQTAATHQDFLSHTLWFLQGGAVGARTGRDSDDHLLFATGIQELRRKILFSSPQYRIGRADSLISLDSHNRRLFDAEWYVRRNALELRGEDALNHFIRKGMSGGLSPSVWFDEIWYCSRWLGSRKEVRLAGYTGGLDHFLQEGASRLLSPAPWVDLSWYMVKYPDVEGRLRRGVSSSVLQDYLVLGASLNYDICPSFEEAWYPTQSVGLSERIKEGGFISGLHHFLVEGLYTGLDPSRFFSEKRYRDLYPDVASAIDRGEITSGFTHFMSYGREEGRLTE